MTIITPELVHAIRWANLATTKDPTRLHLGGVYVSPYAIAGTDGHRLHFMMDPGWEDTFPDRKFILERKALAKAMTRARNEGCAIVFGADRTKAVLVNSLDGAKKPWSIEVPIINYEFPPFDEVIPDKAPKVGVLGATATQAAAKKIAKRFGLTPAKADSLQGRTAVLAFRPKSAVLASFDPGTEPEVHVVPGDSQTKKGRRLCLNPVYVEQALSGITGELATVAQAPPPPGSKGKASVAPVLITDTSDTRRAAVIMPMNQKGDIPTVSAYKSFGHGTAAPPLPKRVARVAFTSYQAFGSTEPRASQAAPEKPKKPASVTKQKPSKPKAAPAKSPAKKEPSPAMAALDESIAAKRSSAAKKAWATRRARAEAEKASAE